MERDYDDIIPEEIETITVLKDASAKILYGARAANGVMVITTKRGTTTGRVVRASVESGITMATRTADYLNSYEYATLYNEARENDGLSPYYSQADLWGYQNSTGANDLFYPDVDHYSEVMDSTMSITKAVIDLTGGNEKVKYATVADYIHGTGYESDPKPTLNRINVRGSLDVNVTDWMRFVVSSVARFETRVWGKLDSSNLITRIATHRPNEYPLTISASDLGLDAATDGTPFFGGSRTTTGNIIADTVYGGYTEERYITSQTNLGLRFDLDKFVKGLSLGGDFMFDIYDYFKQAQTHSEAVYALVDSDIVGDPVFQQVRSESISTSASRSAFSTIRSSGARMMADYNRSIDNHDFSVAAAYNYYFQDVVGKNQNIVNTTTSLRANYIYDDRFSVEGSVALLGSNRYDKNNRFFASRAVGGAWILSNESFMKSSSVVDFLKLKASYGVLGYDAATDYLQYYYAWGNTSSTSFGEANASSSSTVEIVRVASDIDWEYSQDLNVGVEGRLFGSRLMFEFNLFQEHRKDMVAALNYEVADILGGLIEVGNVGEVRNRGVDGLVRWSESRGDFSYSVGTNFTISRNKTLAWNEVDYGSTYYAGVVGQSTSAMYGYVAEGLFGKDVELEGHAIQQLGDYQEGDIAYQDLNNDGFINEADRTVLGDSHPMLSYGVELDLKYKNWGLYILGTGETGVQMWLNNSYYWVDGGDKYTAATLDRWHATNNPNGSYPRLTTYESSNNYVNSSFWMESANYLRLKNVQLSYTFDLSAKQIPVKGLKLYLNGTNLCVASTIKELDPEGIDAGVTNYPIGRTVTAGVSVTF